MKKFFFIIIVFLFSNNSMCGQKFNEKEFFDTIAEIASPKISEKEIVQSINYITNILKDCLDNKFIATAYNFANEVYKKSPNSNSVFQKASKQVLDIIWASLKTPQDKQNYFQKKKKEEEQKIQEEKEKRYKEQQQKIWADYYLDKEQMENAIDKILNTDDLKEQNEQITIIKKLILKKRDDGKDIDRDFKCFLNKIHKQIVYDFIVSLIKNNIFKLKGLNKVLVLIEDGLRLIYNLYISDDFFLKVKLDDLVQCYLGLHIIFKFMQIEDQYHWLIRMRLCLNKAKIQDVAIFRDFLRSIQKNEGENDFNTMTLNLIECRLNN